MPSGQDRSATMMSFLSLRLSRVSIALLLVAALNNSSNALFFQSPKRTIMNFLEMLGGHKQPKPIHHYHLHYYPVPLPKPVHPPPNIEIDFSSLHGGHDHLSPPPDWNSPDYGKIYDAEVIPPSIHADSYWSSSRANSWPSPAPIHPKSAWGWNNNEIVEKDHAYEDPKTPGILLQVPLKQQILVYQPPPKDKSSLLATLLKKLRRINDALFHPEEDSVEEHDHAPHISNSLTYNSP